MDKVTVTEADTAIADSMCNPVDNPYLHRIICNKVAAHRHAAMLEGVRLGLGFAIEVCEATERGVNAKYKDDATETTTAAAAVCLVLARNLAAVNAADVLDPAAIVEGVK